MKVVALNGSHNKTGNTYQALQIAAGELEKERIETEIITVGDKVIRGCTGCHTCKTTGSCVLSDPEFSEILDKIYAADGLLLGSPVYYAGINGTLKSFLDRAFFLLHGGPDAL
jgi:multimeric flavodoxin WrbA